VTKAVVFDLFETLVDYDEQKSLDFSTAAAELLERSVEAFHPLWRAGRAERDSGPLRPYLASIGIEGDAADRLLELRRASSLGLLETPRPGVLETLAELRSRGIGVGLITVCSEDVVDVWEQTPFRGQFGSVVFSCSCGYLKPDPRLYLQACDELGVEPAEALYVGDGTNDELAGAERVGMRAVQIGSSQPWSGDRITEIAQVLELVS
jgi:putative hydrolase of the HAD superfamily